MLVHDPFGMITVGRSWEVGSEYRYGFNGKESDTDTYGEGNIYDYGFRIYNPRLGKFLSVDPLTRIYAWYTPFQFAGNKPIWAIDLDGLEEVIFTESFTQKDNLSVFSSSSDLLGGIMNEISDPSKAETTKIYFMQMQLDFLNTGTKGLTYDVTKRGVSFIQNWEKLYGQTITLDKITNPFEISEYKLIEAVALSMGLSIQELVKLSVENPNLQIYAVIIDDDLVEDNTIDHDPNQKFETRPVPVDGNGTVMKTVFHEIKFHLLKRLAGINENAIMEHEDAFSYKDNKQYYDKIGWDPQSGQSPSENDVAPESEAGKLFQEIDKVDSTICR